MAGSHSNWFKVPAGPMKGQRVFISNATLQSWFGTQNEPISVTKKKLGADITAARNAGEDGGGVMAGLLTGAAGHSPQPGGQAQKKPVGVYTTARRAKKAPAPEEEDQQPTKAPATQPMQLKYLVFTQANGKQVEKQGTQQGGLGVVDTPYGHAIIHIKSGKALAYVNGAKKAVTDPKTGKTKIQNAPDAASHSTAVEVMSKLNQSGANWDRDEAESLSSKAQAALKSSLGGQVSASKVTFKIPPVAGAPQAAAQPTSDAGQANQAATTAKITTVRATPTPAAPAVAVPTPAAPSPGGIGQGVNATGGNWYKAPVAIHQTTTDENGKKREGSASHPAEILDGLAVIKHPSGEGWSITHVNTGLNLFSGKTKAETKAAVTELQKLGVDWTKGDKDLFKNMDPATKEKVKGIKQAAQYGWYKGQTTPAAVPAPGVPVQKKPKAPPKPTVDLGPAGKAKIIDQQGDYAVTAKVGGAYGGQHYVVHTPSGNVVDQFFSKANAQTAAANYAAQAAAPTPTFAPKPAPQNVTAAPRATVSKTVTSTASMSAEDLAKPPVVKPLTIQTKAGPTVIDAAHQGNLAVHKNKENTWSVVSVTSGGPLLKFPTEEAAIAHMRKLNSSGVDWGQHDPKGWNDVSKKHFQDLVNEFGAGSGVYVPSAMQSAIKIIPPKPKPQASILGQGAVDVPPGTKAWQIAPPFGVHYANGNLMKNTEASDALKKEYKAYNAQINGTTNWASTHDMAGVNSYQDGGYTSMNSSLWSSGSDTAHKSLRESIAGIDRVMEQSAAPYDFSTTRAQSQGHPLYTSMAKIEVGDSWKPQGFESSTVDSPLNPWGDGVRVHYRVPKGVTGVGIHLNSLPNSSHPSEHEYLINRRTQWRCVAKTVDENGHIDVVMEYVGREKTIPGQWTYDPTDGVTKAGSA